jgi:hypothetical protein
LATLLRIHPTRIRRKLLKNSPEKANSGMPDFFPKAEKFTEIATKNTNLPLNIPKRKKA